MNVLMNRLINSSLLQKWKIDKNRLEAKSKSIDYRVTESFLVVLTLYTYNQTGKLYFQLNFRRARFFMFHDGDRRKL